MFPTLLRASTVSLGFAHDLRQGDSRFQSCTSLSPPNMPKYGATCLISSSVQKQRTLKQTALASRLDSRRVSKSQDFHSAVSSSIFIYSYKATATRNIQSLHPSDHGSNPSRSNRTRQNNGHAADCDSLYKNSLPGSGQRAIQLRLPFPTASGNDDVDILPIICHKVPGRRTI